MKRKISVWDILMVLILLADLIGFFGMAWKKMRFEPHWPSEQKAIPRTRP